MLAARLDQRSSLPVAAQVCRRAVASLRNSASGRVADRGSGRPLSPKARSRVVADNRARSRPESGNTALAAGTICREARSIFHQYGPELVGRPRTAALCLASRLKGEIYRLCVHLHAGQYLVRRRSTPLTGEQARTAAVTIERIRSTPVPGLPSISPHTAREWAFSSRSDLPIDLGRGRAERGPMA